MKRRNIIALHIAVWTILLASDVWTAYPHMPFTASNPVLGNLSPFLKTLLLQAGYLTIPIFCFYSSYFFIAPRLFVTRQYLLGAALTIAAILGASALRYGLEYYIFLPFLGFDNYGGHRWPLTDFVINVFFLLFHPLFHLWIAPFLRRELV